MMYFYCLLCIFFFSLEIKIWYKLICKKHFWFNYIYVIKSYLIFAIYILSSLLKRERKKSKARQSARFNQCRNLLLKIVQLIFYGILRRKLSEPSRKKIWTDKKMIASNDYKFEEHLMMRSKFNLVPL